MAKRLLTAPDFINMAERRVESSCGHKCKDIEPERYISIKSHLSCDRSVAILHSIFSCLHTLLYSLQSTLSSFLSSFYTLLSSVFTSTLLSTASSLQTLLSNFYTPLNSSVHSPLFTHLSSFLPLTLLPPPPRHVIIIRH